MDFHELANAYPLIPAIELNLMVQDMRNHGFDERFPIVLFERKILDGRNRFIAAERAEIKPEFVVFTGTPEQAKQFVIRAKELRSHLDEEVISAARLARLGRVAEARAAGKSIRTIAAEEEVSTTQVKRDLEVSGVTGGSHLTGEGAKVTGADGKTYAAVKIKPRCQRCTRLWPNADKSTKDCVSCYEIRRKAKPSASFVEMPEEDGVSPPKPLVDDAGTLIPDNLQAVFRQVREFKLFQQQLNRCGKTAKALENCKALKDKKPLDGNKHYGQMFGPIKIARSRVWAMRPALVCSCGGKGCIGCGNTGFLTVEEVEANQG